ncbi:MAG: hypothetical protein KatS3mg076_0247 [Candidatus Binatia bacterium]|nr:MAG: hypothetical protein KatS3mg076_0247 [Candidatus Binatia bacterium]
MQLKGEIDLPEKARARSRERGEGLVGTLVGTALALVALGAFVAFSRAQLFAYQAQATQVDLQGAGRAVLELFVREVRRAGMDPKCAKNFEAIAEARPDRIRIQADLDGNGAIDGPEEDVTYFYDFDEKAVVRATKNASDILLEDVDVTGSVIRYYDGAGQELLPSGTPPELDPAQRTQVRRVALFLTLERPNPAPTSDLPLRVRLSSTVDLRNRFFLMSTVCS